MAAFHFSNFIFRNNSISVPLRKSLRWTSLSSVTRSSKDESHFKFRPLKLSEIPQVIKMRRRFNFFEGVSSYEMCLKSDPESIVASTDSEGKIVAFGCYKKNNENTVTNGYLTVHEEYRNVGISNNMINHFYSSLDDQNMIANREAPFVGWHIRSRHIPERNFICIDYERTSETSADMLSDKLPQGVDIYGYQDKYLPSILEYDNSLMGYKREILVTLNCRDVYGNTFAAFRGSKCVGYGTIKLNIQGGGKVGPLYADEPAIAEVILKKLLQAFVIGKGFATTIVSNNIDAIILFEKLGQLKAINNYRFYLKERFLVDTKKVYSPFDLEYEPF